MPGVKIIVRNNEGDLIELARFLNRTGWQVTQHAEEGTVGISTLYMDDLDESVWDTLGYNVGGRRQIRLVDFDSGEIVHFGYTGRRGIKRKYNEYGNPVGRAWSIEVIDPNIYFTRRVLTHHSAKRPRESDLDRITWLIGAPEWDIIDQFMIGPSESTMSKADYRGQTVADVVSDCSQQSRKNWWIDIVDDGGGDRLTFWYGRETRNAYISTLSISNDLNDLDIEAINNNEPTLVYPPAMDTEYITDPSRIFTGIYGTWEKGAVYRFTPSPKTQIERWDQAMSWPNIHEKDRAVHRAEKMIERLEDEDERIETAILVPGEQAHLVRAGMMIPLKLTHVPRLATYTDCRILKRDLSPQNDGLMYLIPLTLEIVGESAPDLTCSTAVSGAIIAEDENGTPKGFISTSITPESGEDAVILGGGIATFVTTPSGMAMTGAWSEVYAADNVSGDHPSFVSAYQSVSPASGSYDFTAEYDPSAEPLDKWATVVAAIRTSAASPVQDASDSDVSGTVVTLGATPTVGNLLVMIAAVRDDTTIDNPTPADFWTQIAIATTTVGISGDVVGLFVRCVETGDDTGPYGISGQGHVTVMEWEIT